MSKDNLHNYIERLQSRGFYSFSFNDLKKNFSKSEDALRVAIHRLQKQGYVILIHKGFYVIIPVEYRVRGILPANLFIDDLFSNLKRPYYASLLSAAAMYGSSHQAPQVFFVMITLPVLRPIKIKGLDIRFITRKTIPESFIQKIKTDTGTIRVSSPELTAIDLVKYANRIGGLVRVVTVLDGLVPSMNGQMLKKLAQETDSSIASWQRLGYILENILSQTKLANSLFSAIKKNMHNYQPLSLSKTRRHNSKSNRWKILVNTELELEE